MAYTPGLRVATKTIIKKERILPLKGEVMMKVGDLVKRDDIIAKTDLPGTVQTMNVVNIMGIQPDELKGYMLKTEGETFEKDEIIAQTKGYFKFLRTKVPAPIKGSIESISPVTGQILLREPPLPVQVLGYIKGKVVDVLPGEGVVVKTVATFIQGIFGIGGETWGELKFGVEKSSDILTPEKIDESFKDSVIVAGAFANHATIKKAIQVGAKGIVVGGIHDGDLRHILGYDLGVAITGSENVGITIVCTEGFGEIAMSQRAFETLKKREGSIASISGATQIRAGVIRPEIIVSYEDLNEEGAADEKGGPLFLEIGSVVRVIRHPHFGQLGTVSALPKELTPIDSETKCRVLEVEFENGEKAIIPRANVEIIDAS